MSTTSDPVARLRELLDAQLASWGEPTLADVVAIHIPRFSPDEALSEHLTDHRRALAAWLRASLRARAIDASWERSPAAFLGKRLAAYLLRRNQFLSLDALAKQTLDALSRRLLADVAEILEDVTPYDRVHRALADALALHRESLAAFVRERLGASPRDVVSSEYSPELQLAILGRDAPTLAAPLLDVGCGREAALVKHLRARGLDATGFDRDASPDVAIESDFLSFAYGDSTWGTIVSHLAFSLHFLHHHLAADADAPRYAAAYTSMLRSLRVGGLLAYVPALPFLEVLLPSDRYAVTVAEERPGVDRNAVAAVERATGHSFAATHVRRLI